MSQNWPQMFVKLGKDPEGKTVVLATRAFNAEADVPREDGWVSKDEYKRGVLPADPQTIRIAKLTATCRAQAKMIENKDAIIKALEEALADNMRFLDDVVTADPEAIVPPAKPAGKGKAAADKAQGDGA